MRRIDTFGRSLAIATALLVLGASGLDRLQGQADQTEVSHLTGFDGTINTTVADSTSAPLPVVQAPTGSPNVVYIVLDDTGFAEIGSYGAEIATPSIDALAAGGLRYNNFHTYAICSPTRAALLTGRNAHAVGMNDLAGADDGYPNSRGRMPPTAATIAQILQANGYRTYMTGKWHLTPDMSDGGPRTHWPVQKGFDRFYGFLSGWTDQYHPNLIEDNTPLVVPNRPGYHFSEDIVDRSIRYLEDGQPSGRPFFLYLNFGATHGPIQVPRAYVDKYLTTYDKGWDAIREERFARQKQLGIIPADTRLPPGNPADRAWADLSDDERTVYARHMAVYAGFMEHTDEQIGRLVRYLRASGQFDNTLVVLLSDNGAAPEAGPEGSFTSPYGGRLSTADALARIDDLGTDRARQIYPRAWAMAGVTPFREYKLSMFLGGVRDPMIVTWPDGIADRGVIRPQFVHTIDITPTVLEITGIEAPQTHQGVPQMPIHGKSILATMRDARAPDPRDTQVFELRGMRAIYHQGWRAVAKHVNGTPYDDDVWELFEVTRDFAEAENLAASRPDKLRELQDLWWSEARRYGVLPLRAP
jgi:arylsulfatase